MQRVDDQRVIKIYWGNGELLGSFTPDEAKELQKLIGHQSFPTIPITFREMVGYDSTYNQGWRNGYKWLKKHLIAESAEVTEKAKQ